MDKIYTEPIYPSQTLDIVIEAVDFLRRTAEAATRSGQLQRDAIEANNLIQATFERIMPPDYPYTEVLSEHLIYYPQLMAIVSFAQHLREADLAGQRQALKRGEQSWRYAGFDPVFTAKCELSIYDYLCLLLSDVNLDYIKHLYLNLQPETKAASRTEAEIFTAEYSSCIAELINIFSSLQGLEILNNPSALAS